MNFDYFAFFKKENVAQEIPKKNEAFKPCMKNTKIFLIPLTSKADMHGKGYLIKNPDITRTNISW